MVMYATHLLDTCKQLSENFCQAFYSQLLIEVAYITTLLIFSSTVFTYFTFISSSLRSIGILRTHNDLISQLA